MKTAKEQDRQIEKLQSELEQLRQKLASVEAEKNRLQEQYTTYQKAVENTRAVPYLLNFKTGKYDLFGSGCEELLGVPANELDSNRFLAMVQETQILDAHPNMDLATYRRRFLDGNLSSYHADCRILTPDGKEKWLSDHSLPIIDQKSGRVTGSMGLLSDITRRKKQEIAHQTLEKRYRLLFELSPTGIILEDEKGIIIEVNPAVCQALRRSREELIGLDARELSLDPLTKVEENIRRILSGEDLHHVEPTRMKDGATCMMELHETMITLPDGSRNILVITNDITEHIQLESQLRHSQRMEAVGRMAGGIAHDFNNLLTIIRGYCELAMINTKINDDNYKRLELINEAGRRAEAMTQQLLAFSRRQVLKQDVFDLNERIRDLTNLLDRLIGENINLKLNLCKEPTLLKSDAGQIDQVILNLVINARDAMPDGGTLIISSRLLQKKNLPSHINRIKGKNLVCLSITDNGLGMDDDVQKHIFEPFFTTRAPGEGTGLGLSTAYGIIRQCGGSIQVSSEVNIGSTFDIYLPLITDEEVIAGQSLEKNPVLKKGTGTIFIAEDEPDVRQLIAESLKNVGYQVDTAFDGFAAYEQLSKNRTPPDLLITDVVMPQMSGTELVIKMRQKFPDLKILYISGYANLPAEIEEEVMNNENYLQKPFTPTQLLKKIHTILHGPA